MKKALGETRDRRRKSHHSLARRSLPAPPQHNDALKKYQISKDSSSNLLPKLGLLGMEADYTPCPALHLLKQPKY